MPRGRRTRLALLVMALLGLAAGLPLGPGPTDAPPPGNFPLGVFEDANRMHRPADFERMLDDLRAHGLDSVMLTNSSIERDEPLLTVADRKGFSVLMLPAFQLNEQWWPAAVPATLARARQVAAPIVAALGAHSSLKGYIVKDEPSLGQLEKVGLLSEALREADPGRPVMPILIGTDRVGPIAAVARPDVLLLDVYPAGAGNPPCDFRLTGFGYSELDFVSYIRLVGADRPAGTPLWLILQTHSFDAGGFSLREPLAAEVRMQHWLAIGEGATGIFWFVYSTQQSWVGLVDNPRLYPEVGALAARTRPLRSLLLGLSKTADQFRVASAGEAYVSTLSAAGGEQLYAVVVNRDCRHARQLAVGAPQRSGQLRDLESGQIYALGAPILVQPGDGRILELTNRHLLPFAAHTGPAEE